MPQEELRARLGIEQKWLALVASHWPEIRVDGAVAALAALRPALSPAREAEAHAYLACLRASPWAPPHTQLDAELHRYLAEQGDIIDAGGGVCFAAETYHGIESRIVAHLGANGEITLAEVRDMFGTSRRYAQALLEEMDRRRVTRRVGDARVLRKPGISDG
jgi:selenocysteine-specific elongation factor